MADQARSRSRARGRARAQPQAEVRRPGEGVQEGAEVKPPGMKPVI